MMSDTLSHINYSRLRLACRRGMLELDIILMGFLESYYEILSDQEKFLFARLLTAPDPELLNWLMGYSIPQDINLVPLIKVIQNHA